EESITVTCEAAPPDSSTRQIPLLARAKMITPSRFQEPPRGPAAAHNVWAGPPDASIFFRFSSAKKPMNRLSGDQKGGTPRSPPSVPASLRTSKESSRRIQIEVPPSSPLRVSASLRPSGDRASTPAAFFSGIEI